MFLALAKIWSSFEQLQLLIQSPELIHLDLPFWGNFLMWLNVACEDVTHWRHSQLRYCRTLLLENGMNLHVFSKCLKRWQLLKNCSAFFFFFHLAIQSVQKTEQYYRTCNILQMAPPKTRSLPQLTKTPPGEAPAPSKTTLTQRLVNIRLEQIELWAACQAEGAEGKVKHSPNVAYLLQAKVAANLPISLALFTLDFHTTHTEN